MVFLCVAAFSLSAEARSERPVGWRFSQVWATSVRLLRVDMKCSIVEKDKDTGYLLFDCPNATKSSMGSLELVRGGDLSTPTIKASVHMDKKPSYVEQHFLDKLERKLKADYGEPLAVAPMATTKEASKKGQAESGPGGVPPQSKGENEDDLEVDEKDLEDANQEK
jgi:hypothetical protein